MPRTTVSSKANAVLQYFRTASMEAAELVLDLSRGVVRERQDRAEVIRAAQHKAATARQRAEPATGRPAARPAVAASTETPAKGKSHKAKAKARRKATNGRRRGGEVNDEKLPAQLPMEDLDPELELIGAAD